MGIFDLFKRKKEINKLQDNKESHSFTMVGTFAETYNGYLAKFASGDIVSLLHERANVLIAGDNYEDKSRWVEALAICETALSEKILTEDIKELYRQIYSRNWNKYVSMDFEDQDYKCWFEVNCNLNEAFIKSGHTRGYCEQADLYGSARKGYRDLSKKMEYLVKGVEAKDPASLGDYGYGIYLGLPEYGNADKEEGRRLVNQSRELGYESADLLLLYIDFYDAADNLQLLKDIEDFIKKTEKEYRKPYHILADYYQRREDNFDKALEAMKKGVDLNIPYCKYMLGMNMLNGRIANSDKNEGIALLEDAFEHNVVYAANFLGQYYNYANDENTSVEKSVYWHEKAALYCNAESSFELACLYLYNEKLRDIPQGLEYIEQAIKQGSVRALSEKAYLILETDILDTDIEQAKQLLEDADSKGNEYAPYRLGLAYQNGEFGGESDYVKALGYFERGADRDHIYSLELAGNYYRVGVGGDSEEAARKAVSYLTKAIDRGSNYAKVELAFCYDAGYGVEQDYQKAFDLFKAASDNNYPYANTRLASYYEDGLLGKEDYVAALEQYKIAADAGLPDAIYHVGRYHKYAVGIAENPQIALDCFRKAAEAGSAPGLVELALAYEQEYGGIEFDADKAISYMQQAAEKEYTYGQYKLGTYYYYGLKEVDLEKAKYWFEKSNEQGYPYSALMLGDFYLYNIEGKDEPDYGKSFQYYKQAADQGVVSEGIGVCYEYGFGVEANETEAFKYYTLAAAENYVPAKYRLGLCYKYGTGTSINMVEAYRWLSDAAQNGNIYAIYESGMMLLSGDGITKDEEQGAKMLLQAAEENYDWAQFELGNCYLAGRGVPEDDIQAMVWYQKAADNGNEQAQKVTGRRERRKR